MSGDKTNATASAGPVLSEWLGPLPTPWVCVRDNDDAPVSVWRAFQMRDYARAEVERAVAAERERWSRARELAAQCAEWHIGDGDECGEIARELYELLRPNVLSAASPEKLHKK